MTIPKIKRVPFRSPPECRWCGSGRGVRDGQCTDCRPKHPLERRLENRGWTLADLQKRAEVGRASIMRLLAGEEIDAEVVGRIAKAVGLPFDGLLRPAKKKRTP